MHIKSIKLTNFRNHESLNIHFDSNLTLILGANGIGKTNILEAIYLLSTSKSLKAEKDTELIKFDEEFCRIEAEVQKNGDEAELELFIGRSPHNEQLAKKNLKVNKISRRSSSFIQNLHSVIFAPQDIEIIAGSPTQRRKFIDNILVQTHIEYLKLSNDYVKVLRQRNKTLEMINKFQKGREVLPIWTEKLIELGTEIQNHRKSLFLTLNEVINKHIKILNANSSEIELIYQPNIINHARFWDYAEKEIINRTTLIGPHRDDFRIVLNNIDISKFGSRGQQRTSLMALKLAEIDYIENKTGYRPLLLLDDIFSELDEIHRDAIKNIADAQQTIITSTENTTEFNDATTINLV